jgi:tRNA-specific 2-thiouridylase
MADVELLKVGRHFRLGENKIIVGRNEAENEVLTLKKARNDYCFEVPDVSGPTSLLQGLKTRRTAELAAALTAFYSDAESKVVTVNFGRERLDKAVTVPVPSRAEVESYRIA